MAAVSPLGVDRIETGCPRCTGPAGRLLTQPGLSRSKSLLCWESYWNLAEIRRADPAGCCYCCWRKEVGPAKRAQLIWYDLQSDDKSARSTWLDKKGGNGLSRLPRPHMSICIHSTLTCRYVYMVPSYVDMFTWCHLHWSTKLVSSTNMF